MHSKREPYPAVCPVPHPALVPGRPHGRRPDQLGDRNHPDSPKDDLGRSTEATAPGRAGGGATVSRAGRKVAGWLILLVPLVAGVALRVWILRSPFSPVDADEAVVGLMARHALRGDI